MPKVSIIMPSLNVAKFMEECLESVAKQTLKDIEILCVDAGSTDGTLEIIKKYAEKDARIKLINSEKRSYGYQMNLGISIAKGEYIGIVETDDFIAEDMYETLYREALAQSADFVKSDFNVFTTLEEGERVFLKYSLKKNSGIEYNCLRSWKDYVASNITVDIFVWNGIYKKSFLEKNNIRFNETPGAAFQDCGFRYQVALAVERGYFIEKSFYNYRRDNINSSTYNSKCILFNLNECKYLQSILNEKYLNDKERVAYMAREFTVIALAPYKEFLRWRTPSEETSAALVEFRTIFLDYISKGILSWENVANIPWIEIRMFVEAPEFYEYYAQLNGDIQRKACIDFVNRISKNKPVILYGAGEIGAAAYCLISLNKATKIQAFCDSKRSGMEYMNCEVLSPEDAVLQYPEAVFVITAGKKYRGEIVAKLHELGVSEEDIVMYNLPYNPMYSTNIFMGSRE